MQVNMDEARSNLSDLGGLAWKGEEVIIAKVSRPFLRLTPYDVPQDDKTEDEPERRRLSGALKGRIWIAPDFDDTPEDLIDLFYDGGESASFNLSPQANRVGIGTA